MRAFGVVVHRWLGLATAAFLFVSGLTGAVISWDHELDEWLNPHLYQAPSAAAARSPLELAARVEAADPRVRVSFLPLQHEPGHAALIGVAPRVDASSGQLFEPGYNQIFLDPVSAQVLGQREWGAVSLARENLMSFLYELHYSLHLPVMGGVDRWGVWLMGIVALVWLLDSFVAFCLTLPAPRPGASRSWLERWQPAWRVRRGARGLRLHFDLHRAFGLWTWLLLLLLAFTAASLNLYRELFWPALNAVSSVTPGPFELRTPRPLHEPIAPQRGYAEVIDVARADAIRRGWTEPAGYAFYAQHYGVYGVAFHQPGNDHGTGGMGVKTLYYDGIDGRALGSRVPWQGTAADVFVQLQFPVHSGRILGIPGRIAVSVMGVVVAMLSVTGVVIWARKRRARAAAYARLSSRHRTARRASGSHPEDIADSI